MAEDDKTRLEKALHETEVMTKAVLDNSPDYILTVGKDSTILFANRMLPGMGDKQTFGLNAAEYIPQEYSAKMTDALKNVFQKGETTGFEFDMMGPDGSTLWYSARIAAAKDGAETAAAIVTISDVTKTKNLDAEKTELKKQMAEATKQGSPQEQDLAKLKAQNQTLEQDNKKLQQQLTNLPALTQQLQKMQQESQNLRQQLTTLTAQSQQAPKALQENAQLKQQMQTLQQENNTLKQQTQGAQQALKTQQENAQLKQQTQTQQQENSTLKQQIQTLQAQAQQAQKLQDENAQLKQQAQTQQQENSTLKQQTQTLQGQSQQMQKLQQENAQLKQQTQTLQQENGTLKQQTQTLQQENGTLKQQTQSMQTQGTQQTQKLQAENEGLRQQLKKQEIELQLLGNENKRIRELDDENKALKEDKKELETENQILGKQHQESVQQGKIQAQQIKVLQEENAQYETQVKTLIPQSQKAQELEKENDGLRRDAQAAANKAAQDAQRLKAEADELRQQVQKMTQEAAETAEKLEKAQDQEWRLLNFVEKEKEKEKEMGAEITHESEELKADYKILYDLNKLVQDRMKQLDRDINKEKKNTFIIRPDSKK